MTTNTTDKKVMTLDFDMDKMREVNWKNVLNDNIPNLANSYWEHSVLDSN